jgi:hypothetical protein
MLGARPRVRPPSIYIHIERETHTYIHIHVHITYRIFGNTVLQPTAALQPSDDGMAVG